MNTDTVILPDAPIIPGLNFRRFRGEADYPGMVAVLDGSKIPDHLEYIDTVDDIRNDYAHLTNCNPYEDMLMVEMHNQLIGYNRIFWTRELTGAYIYVHFGFLDPKWRGKGIGTAMIHAAEARLREIAAGHPQDKPHLLRVEVTDHQSNLKNILESEGYTTIRYGYEMTCTLEEPIEITPMPAGLETRPAQPESYHLIWEANNEAFQDHWGYTPPTESEFEEWQNSRIFNPELWQVAWDGDQIAGMVLNFYDPDENQQFNRLRGYTEGISVRRPWRKQGLARALLTRSLHMFKSMGMTEAALGVDAENLSGALGLYESVGFRAISRMAIYQKEL